ncbi:HDOD domain-containing protein [Pleionea sediminis]|uniref:HDOD domain-containing protein n=1 Tax=Pleionea sediminis TaxID=2569479 RepID=UPI001186B82A|nr:HDOD domain-containing protein [Pleionea sediminis]
MVSLANIKPEQIPMPDEAIFRLMKACTEPETEVEDLSKLISANAIISSRLISIANSAFYSFSQSIESVSHAIVAMGLGVVKNITLCFAIKETVSQLELDGIDIDEFWKDALYRAVACQLWFESESNKLLSEHEKSEAFTCGLLADIGFLTLFILSPEKLDRWPVLYSNTPNHRLRMEHDLFSTDHCEIGAELLAHWSLPQRFVSSIAHHHEASHQDPLVKSLRLADWSVALLNSCNKVEAQQVLLSSQTSIKEESLQELFDDLHHKVKEASSALDVSKDVEFDLNEVFQQANKKLAEDNLSYQELTWKLQDALLERDVLAEKLNSELEVAREIQQSFQSDISNCEYVAAINIPAKKLSGDFFDYYEHEDGSISFCLGDVSGKGTHAALVMTKTISLYRCLSKVESNLKAIINLINDEICETSVRGMFVTFIAGKIDFKQKKLELVNAGHIPALQIGESSISQIEPHGPPLGVVEAVNYTPEVVSFDNHRLYLYTDGITEAHKANGEELGTKAFVQWIVESKKLSLKEQLSCLQRRFESDIESWEDDLTLMMLSSR